MMPDYIIQIVYFVGAFLLIIGLKRMSIPENSRGGLAFAGLGLLLTVLITFFHSEVNSHYLLMTVAILIGGTLAFINVKKSANSEIPKMTALYNGLGGGAVASIAALELITLDQVPDFVKYLAMLAALLGSISFSGSLIAFAKLKGLIRTTINLPMHQWLNALVFVIAATFGIAIVLNGDQYEMTSLVIFFVLSLALGILITLPLDNASLPISIALLNSFTGIGLGFIGYVLSNPAMMIAGFLVGATALTLTQLISKAKNRPISNALFGDDDKLSQSTLQTNHTNKNIKQLSVNDAATMMAFAKSVIIVPGYGMAISQAQHKLGDLSKQLTKNNVNVKFAIHPVAGRMPGHMNLLLSEAGIAYDLIQDIDEVNDDFETADVVLVIGANDIINPSARSDQSSPLLGMPILNADKAKNVIIVKRGEGKGFSDIDNPLFYQGNTGLIYGDADSVLDKILSNLKSI